MDQFHFDPALQNFFKTGHTNVFHINPIEETREILKFPLPPHRKTVNDFVFLTKGKSIRSKGLEKYEFTKNTFFFLPAYQISTHDGYSKDAEGYYCHFDSEVMARHIGQPGFLNQFPFLHFTGNPLVKVDERTAKTVLSFFPRLEKENALASPDYALISAYLHVLFLELLPFASTSEKSKENAAMRVTRQYKDALAQHIYTRQNVSDYARLLNVTTGYLNKCVKGATGKSAQDILSEMKLMEAKLLLQQTSLSVSEIAFKIGKEDPSDFTRFFKSKTDLTPSQYREMS